MKLLLEKDQYIIISSSDTIQTMNAYSDGDASFKKHNQCYQIYGEFPIQIFLLTLQTLLTKSLFGNLPLHHSISQDIGYLWNQQGNDPTFISIKYTDQNNDTYWIGKKYELSSYDYVAWIYNDEQSHIIFEITPAYPRCINQENEQEIAHYQKWMQEYKPACKIIISQKAAQEWVEQCQQILDIIDKNSQTLYGQE
ncbi:hypothetical protein KBC04_02765 [Candidatus Babeliales bacterium]|nr:hypothetical protein [Candidatus Babeliales bacterium]MBP9844025.1 hypothetical protein [Candidatus Babeliales bacterium]